MQIFEVPCSFSVVYHGTVSESDPRPSAELLPKVGQTFWDAEMMPSFLNWYNLHWKTVQYLFQVRKGGKQIVDRFTKNGNSCEKRRSYRCFKHFLFPPLPGEMKTIDYHIFQMGWNPPVWVTFWPIFGFGKALGPQLESSTPLPELVVSWQQCRLVQILLGQTVLKLLGNSKDVACHMGVEPKIGGNPPKWMVKIMENPIKIHDLGAPLCLETPISYFAVFLQFSVVFSDAKTDFFSRSIWIHDKCYNSLFTDSWLICQKAGWFARCSSGLALVEVVVFSPPNVW